MSNLVRVWDKEGKAHDVSNLNAVDLCQIHGWTRSGPSDVSTLEQPEPEVPVVEVPEVEVTEEPAPVVEPVPEVEEAPVEAEEKPKKGRGRPKSK